MILVGGTRSPRRTHSLRRGLTPADPSSLPNRPDSLPPLRLVALSAPRSPGAGPPVSHDTGQAAVGRAGSFNSGKNVTVLPVVKVRRTGTGKNVVLPD